MHSVITMQWNVSYDFNTENGAAMIMKLIFEQHYICIEVDSLVTFQPLNINSLVSLFNLDKWTTQTNHYHIIIQTRSSAKLRLGETQL